VPRQPKKPQRRSSTEPGLADRAYDELRRRILEGEYQPGEATSEYQLSADLNMSRTPIREALRELAKLGLVETIPQKGVFISELTVQDIAEVFQLREVLECFAARLAAKHMTHAQRMKMSENHHYALEYAKSGEARKAYDYAVLMHKSIMEAAGNKRLTKLLDQLEDQTHRLGLLTLKSDGRLQAALEEHGQIIDRIQAGDEEGAADAMLQHLKADQNVAMAQVLPIQLPKQNVS